MHDILLRNALIADPEADSLRTGDVAVEGGCIVEAIGSACTTIDCSGLVLQPGIIDTHVELRHGRTSRRHNCARYVWTH